MTSQGSADLLPFDERVRQYAAERLAAQLQTDPVDEGVAEAWLCGAYEAVGLPPPTHMLWVDGPLELIALLGEASEYVYIEEAYCERISGWAWEMMRHYRSITPDLLEIDQRVRDIRTEVRFRQLNNEIQRTVFHEVELFLEKRCYDQTAYPLLRALEDDARYPFRVSKRYQSSMEGYVVWQGVSAFVDAPELAYSRWFDEHVKSNRTRHLAHFNEMVSGYWCGATVAIIVRKPCRSARDAEGRLHSASGRALEYRDGWGFSAWHGVVVPDYVIANPERLTIEDFLHTSNLAMRRAIQEIMGGEQFIWSIGATYIHSDAQGVLYEVALPKDPDEVARYVQVSDASTVRVYYLRVPPYIQTATEAVAWTFGMSVEAYAPTQET